MTALLIFACTFGVVLALTVQHLNINGNHQAMAFFTSVLIGLFNLVLLKVIPQPTSVWEIAAYLFGGPLGIVTAMRLHPAVLRWYLHRAAPQSLAGDES